MEVTVYPNLTQGMMHVDISGIDIPQNAQIEIFSANGALVLRRAVISSNYTNGHLNNIKYGNSAVSFATSYGISSLAMAGIQSSSTLAQIGGWTIAAGKITNVVSTVGSAISNFDNAGKILMGKAYADNLWQGISRVTWERPQSWAGYNYTQFRNMGGNVDRVDYFGGATWATKENAGKRDGISMGNYININIDNEITGSFQNRVISDPLFMHEYGHTIQSRNLGLLYLGVVGLPSLFSAGNSRQVDGETRGVSTHDFRKYEMRANRHAANYFERYDVDWNSPYHIWGAGFLHLGTTIETFYPRRRR